MSTHDCPEDPLDVIHEEARAVAKCFGVTTCDEMAEALVDRIMLRIGGGSYVYLGQRRSRDRDHRDAEIRAEFSGTNIKALARKWHISPRQIRRIVNR